MIFTKYSAIKMEKRLYVIVSVFFKMILIFIKNSQKKKIVMSKNTKKNLPVQKHKKKKKKIKFEKSFQIKGRCAK
jgi:hypothetical protein